MMKANRIAQLAKKWQRIAALRLSLGVAVEADECCTSMASKGHCVVYTADKRFEVPLAYLGTPVFAVLLQISQEEFGFVSDGRWVDLTSLWCRSHGVCHVPAQERSSAELEKAFLNTMVASCHYASCVAPSVGVSHQVAVCSSWMGVK
ncbi:hypothetical protein GQ55_2G343200 [Panicum hallii var. hallii]|uniref:DUF5615 domain-containing protein n=1 Tax=Panicum hallii var. hallii TaxID=1504633 RepID=A0A2T7EVE5_9POAL|nr:hypothetical protein GQ55_2G343200 [Panicum hallii var. hallii]